MSSANFNLCDYLYFLSQLNYTFTYIHLATRKLILPEDTLSLFSFIKSSWLLLTILLSYFWCWMVMVVLLQSSYFSLLKSFFKQTLSHKTKEQQCRTKLFDIHTFCIHVSNTLSIHDWLFCAWQIWFTGKQKMLVQIQASY